MASETRAERVGYLISMNRNSKIYLYRQHMWRIKLKNIYDIRTVQIIMLTNITARRSPKNLIHALCSSFSIHLCCCDKTSNKFVTALCGVNILRIIVKGTNTQ